MTLIRIVLCTVFKRVERITIEKRTEFTIGGDGETFLSNGYKRVLFSGDLKRKGKFREISIFENEEETEMEQEIKAFVEDELFKDSIVDVRWNR